MHLVDRELSQDGVGRCSSPGMYCDADASQY